MWGRSAKPESMYTYKEKNLAKYGLNFGNYI